jgi:hypothetical protein
MMKSAFRGLEFLRTSLMRYSFDLEFPTQCDDEFWESSAFGKPFEQPKNRPSSISFFIWDLRLQYIVSFALRTVVSKMVHVPFLQMLTRCIFKVFNQQV